MASLREVADAMATALSTITTGTGDLQIVPYRWFKATPPAIDIYPADPAQEDAAFGPDNSLTVWTVRARAGTTDEQGQQDVLLQLMEPSGPTSVRAALHDSDNLDGAVEGLHVDRPTGYRLYDELGAQAPLIGVEWRVRAYLSSQGVS